MKHKLSLFLFLLLLAFGLSTAAAHDAAPSYTAEELLVIGEEMGMQAHLSPISPDCTFDAGYQVYLCLEPLPAVLPRRNPADAIRARALLGTSGLLLVPDSTNKRVMAFDPQTGDLVDANFIPPDPTNLVLPINAILDSTGTAILVSDDSEDVVQAYDLDGNYLGVFAPAGGPNPAVLQNPRGMELRANGNLLVTTGGGGNIDSVVEFDTAGNYVGVFIASGSGGLDSPYDVLGRANDWLVAGITSDAIHRYDLNGSFLDLFTPVDNFPEQLQAAANSNILVANFSGGQKGILEYTSGGSLVANYLPINDGYRGVYELPNGNLLVAAGTGSTGTVFEMDRQGNIVSVKLAENATPRYIEWVQLAQTVFTINYQYAMNNGDTGSGVYTYFNDGSYTDESGGTGIWVVRQPPLTLLMRYDPGFSCNALALGGLVMQSQMQGIRFCRDGSGAVGFWVGTVVPGNLTTLPPGNVLQMPAGK